MATLVHISDLHFGWPYLPEVGDAVVRLVEEVAPDALVISGDFVQRGDFERLWLDAKQFVARFACPKIMIPGNHDIPLWNPLRRVISPFDDYRRHIAEVLDPVLHVPGVVIAGIATPRPWILDLGYVSPGQLAGVRRALEAAPPGALRVVTMHHGLVPQKAAGLSRHHVRGSRRAIAELADMGADLVLSGHNHYPHVEVCGNGRGPNLVQAQAGTACSKRLRGRGVCDTNSVNIVRSRGRSFDVEARRYDRTARAFVAAEPRRFERDAAARFDYVGAP